MKKIVLLLLLFIAFTSCKTGTLVVVPIPNIEITIYPPQTNLDKVSSYNFYSNNLGMNNYFNNNLFYNNIFITNNNLFRKNFVYLK